MMAEFTIVIPTYNNKTQLEKCLDSIAKHVSQDFLIIVCDDGSTDGTIEFIENLASNNHHISLLQHPDKQNKGRATNRNQCLPRLNTPYVLFLDSDCELRSDILAEHAKVLKSNTNSVSLSGTFYTNSDKNVWSAYLGTRGNSKFHHLQKVAYKYLNTENFALQTNQFVQLGGFDTAFKIYGGEDIEFGCRLKKAFNPDFIVNSKAVVYSEMDKSLDLALSQLEEFGRFNLKYIYQKHPESLDIFHIYFLVNNSFRSILYRLVLNDCFGSILKFLLPIFPIKLKIQAINYLVALKIKKGFLSVKNN